METLQILFNPIDIPEMTFEGIELPASISNPAGSQGEFFFEITPLPNLQEGTVISNNAAIYFDNNPPVITNTVINTLRVIPDPIADFTYQRDCGSIDNVYTFTYTGGTSDNATFYWNFGDANPAFSTDENPGNIVFNNTGVNEVILTVERYGCTDSYFLTIDVPVVTCGNDKKILICHIPPGNPENPQTICISPEALPAHLAHGDCVGACHSEEKSFNPSYEKDKPQSYGYLTVYPNPANEKVTFGFSSEKSGQTTLILYDNTGKKVSLLFDGKIDAGQNKKIEYSVNGLSNGLYLAILKTTNTYKLLKVSVQN